MLEISCELKSKKAVLFEYPSELMYAIVSTPFTGPAEEDEKSVTNANKTANIVLTIQTKIKRPMRLFSIWNNQDEHLTQHRYLYDQCDSGYGRKEFKNRWNVSPRLDWLARNSIVQAFPLVLPWNQTGTKDTMTCRFLGIFRTPLHSYEIFLSQVWRALMKASVCQERWFSNPKESNLVNSQFTARLCSSHVRRLFCCWVITLSQSTMSCEILKASGSLPGTPNRNHLSIAQQKFYDKVSKVQHQLQTTTTGISFLRQEAVQTTVKLLGGPSRVAKEIEKRAEKNESVI